ncbi:MAG: hypothetical protein H6739_34845 [Alphaproteobacteria bacterium]|nr:hypothetical protein [Alphaproteobacteria bacterium]
MTRSNLAARMFASALGLSLSAVAFAQGVPSLPGDEQAEVWPELRWVSFVDDAGGEHCDPVESRDGLCIEEVRFDPLMEAKGSWATDDDTALARARNTSDLNGWLWEDITWQLSDPETPAGDKIVGLGVTRPPPLASQWDAVRVHETSAGRDGRELSVALPEHAGALSATRWREDPVVAPNAHPLFPDVRYQHVPEAPQPAPLVMLSGRFAQRLGYQGRRLTCDGADCNILDIGPETAGPFYEQLYPFRRDRVGDEGRPRPLVAFVGTTSGPDGEAMERTTGVPLATDDMASLLGVADDHFGTFARLLGSRVAEFGMIDHTANQMRVFTALTAMSYPPGGLESTTGMTRDIVAAALGQTDDEAAALSRLGSDPLAIRESFILRYDQLPESVVNAWVAALLGWSGPPSAEYWPPTSFWQDLDADVQRDMEDLRRRGLSAIAPLPRTVDDAELQRWARENLREAINTQAIAQDIRYRALVRLVDRLPEADTPGVADGWTRERVETWILLDHLHQAFANTFDATPGVRRSPNDVTTAGTDQWRTVLSRHGVISSPIGQGLGAVDPMSICTTLDGRSALSEPVFGAVDIDLVLSATDGATGALAVLWERRGDLPFLAIDQPATTRPRLDRLSALPGDRALYRVRWKVWTGWHLLWSREAGADGTTRAVLRVAAVCDDMVFTAPDDLATVVRAAMLDDVFRPTEPTLRRELDEPRRKAPAPQGDTDLAVAGAMAVVAKTEDVADAVETTGEQIAAGETTARTGEVVDSTTQLDLGRALVSEVAPSDALSYLRSVVVSGLARSGTAGQPMVIFVFHHSVSPSDAPLRDTLPRTPYGRVKRAAGEGLQVRSAGWVMFSEGLDTELTPLGPDFRPRFPPGAQVSVPRWTRPRTLDWTLGLGLSHFPSRRVWSDCAYTTTTTSWDATVAPCASIAALTGSSGLAPKMPLPKTGTVLQQTEGFGVDFQGMASFWPHDRPRLAGEFGLETRLDILHAGQSWYWGPAAGADPGVASAIQYDWSYRFQAGPIVGLRFAPPPPGLWRHSNPGSERAPVPWGADAPDGATRSGRIQAGVRGGFLMGPGFNGMEYTALTELWAARSLMAERAPAALVSPYRPLVLFGPFVRVQYGFTSGVATERYLVETGSWTVNVGVRTQLRLGGAAPEPPEVSIPE